MEIPPNVITNPVKGKVSFPSVSERLRQPAVASVSPRHTARAEASSVKRLKSFSSGNKTLKSAIICPAVQKNAINPPATATEITAE